MRFAKVLLCLATLFSQTARATTLDEISVIEARFSERESTFLFQFLMNKPIEAWSSLLPTSTASRYGLSCPGTSACTLRFPARTTFHAIEWLRGQGIEFQGDAAAELFQVLPPVLGVHPKATSRVRGTRNLKCTAASGSLNNVVCRLTDAELSISADTFGKQVRASNISALEAFALLKRFNLGDAL